MFNHQATRLRFSLSWFYTPKINSLYTTWKTTFIKSVQLFSIPRRQQLVQLLFYTKKTLLYNSSLWMITIYPISLETCMWLWTRFLIGRLSEFFTMLCEEIKVKTSFLENRIFQQSLDRKLMFLIGVQHVRTTSLFIGVIYGQLRKLST